MPSKRNSAGTTEVVVMYDSPEAAWPDTTEGWRSRDGRFFVGPDAERFARYIGCTHRTCECGNPASKHWTCCDSCRAKNDRERWEKAEKRPWIDGPIYADDRYFQDEDEVFSYCEEYDLDPWSLRFYLCDPQYASEVTSDYWQDILPSDDEGTLPPAIQEALDAFNKALHEYGKPLSYYPGKYRPDYDWSSVAAALEEAKRENPNV